MSWSPSIRTSGSTIGTMSLLLAERGVARERMGVGADRGVARDAGADVDDRAPLGEPGAEPAILREPLAQAIEPFGDHLAGAERQRLGALVDLDAGRSQPACLDHLDQRRAVLGVLADGLVVEDDAGDVLRHRVGRAEQQLAVVAAVVRRSIPTPIASKRFLMVPEDSSAARMPRPGATMASATLLSSARFIVCLLMRSGFWPILAASARRWQSGMIGSASFRPQHLDPRQALPSSHSRKAPPAVET